MGKHGFFCVLAAHSVYFEAGIDHTSTYIRIEYNSNWLCTLFGVRFFDFRIRNLIHAVTVGAGTRVLLALIESIPSIRSWHSPYLTKEFRQTLRLTRKTNSARANYRARLAHHRRFTASYCTVFGNQLKRRCTTLIHSSRRAILFIKKEKKRKRK